MERVKQDGSPRLVQRRGRTLTRCGNDRCGPLGLQECVLSSPICKFERGGRGVTTTQCEIQFTAKDRKTRRLLRESAKKAMQRRELDGNLAMLISPAQDRLNLGARRTT